MVIHNTDGGTVSVNDEKSALNGVCIKIKSRTLAADEETIAVALETELPGPFSDRAKLAGTIQASKVLSLTRSGKMDLTSPAEITLPYDKQLVAARDVPVVLVWDSRSKKYSAVGIKAIDRIAGTVTFLSVHFDRFVVAVIKRPAATG